MMTKKGFALATGLLALVGFSASAVVGWNSHSQNRASNAAWAFEGTAPDLIRHAGQIFFGKTAASYPSREVVSSSRDHTMTFEVVEFDVISGLKGVEAGEKVFVERAAAIVEGDGKAVPIDVDGGPFTLGNAYLLFVDWQPEGPFVHQVNADARYEVDKKGVIIAPEPEEAVGRVFHGKTVEEAAAIIKGTLKAPK